MIQIDQFFNHSPLSLHLNNFDETLFFIQLKLKKYQKDKFSVTQAELSLILCCFL